MRQEQLALEVVGVGLVGLRLVVIATPGTGQPSLVALTPLVFLTPLPVVPALAT
eukprot:COSAG04_NODE_8694_length_942_cov_0.667853_1_plen_53_part_01